MYARIYVEISNVCNMNCSFCHGSKREKRQMTLGEFARVASNLKGITEHLCFHVLGEPLTHPLLPTFIDYAKNCGYKVALTTNGTLLSLRESELLSSKPYKINVSLHSFEGESRESRNAYINSCVDFAEKASREGILVVLRLWNLPADSLSASDNDKSLNEAVRDILLARYGDFEAVSARGARIHHRLHLEYAERFQWPDASRDDSGENVFCHGLGDHFGILADGSVIPCCLDAEGDMTLGNIFEEDVRNVLKSDRAVAIAKGFEKKKAVEDLCRKCPYARRFKI